MKNKSFLKHESILQCPICKKNLKVFEEKSLICHSGHCFDIGKQGYTNFVQKGNDFYRQDLFISRRNIFEKKFYDAVLLELDSFICKYAKEGLVLDVGCGEGYYLKSITKRCIKDKIGLDISKEAIKLAAKSDDKSLWLVADLENIPLVDKSIDLILNILTPANYKEFKRILKADGCIVKIIPGKNYLIELRELAKPYLKNDNHENARVIEHFKENVKLLEKINLCYNINVTEEEAFDFANMTPMLTKVDLKKLDFVKLKNITIDLEILVGRY